MVKKMKILIEIAEVIQKIQAGIQHKNTVLMKIEDHGLVIRATIKCTKDRREYCFERVFAFEDMVNSISDKDLIKSFINMANNEFRKPYLNT